MRKVTIAIVAITQNTIRWISLSFINSFDNEVELFPCDALLIAIFL